ncbi:S-adenosyl-L-methionine-dependent methyltransferase [Trichoderma aethiopicum]
MSASNLAKEALSTWETNAEFWDSGIGETGNKYWKQLQRPSLERLLGPTLSKKSGRSALELATGNGLCARWLADNGASSIIATDGTFGMLEQASKYMDEDKAGKISFRKLDVTEEGDFVPLVEKAAEIGGFDVVLMNMAIMDVATLDPLANALPKLLSKDGVFVATLLHPVFMTSTYSRTVEVTYDPQTGDQIITRSKSIREYLHVKPSKGVFVVGQETRQYYFHRPLHELLGVFFKRGLILDALEEPSFTDEDGDSGKAYATVNFPQLPPILSLRFRRGL